MGERPLIQLDSPGTVIARSTLPSRARPDTRGRLLLRGLYAPLFPVGWVRPWRTGRGGNVYCELESLRPLVVYNRSLTAQYTVIMLSAEVGVVTSNRALLAVFRMWGRMRSGEAQAWDRPFSAHRARYTDDTQSIHSYVFPTALCRALRCDRCLQLPRDPTGHCPFTAVTRVQIPSGTPTLSTTCKSPPEFCTSVNVR